jgi:uncharacterized protein YdhG (YjbR/CyaY superfamily)
MRRNDSSPEAYRDDVGGEQREILDRIRDTIFATAPGIDEIIEHGMLGYPGLANLGAQKRYVALYVKPSVLDGHRKSFSGVSCGKSCLRFSRLDQVDTDALCRLLTDVLRTRPKD